MDIILAVILGIFIGLAGGVIVASGFMDDQPIDDEDFLDKK